MRDTDFEIDESAGVKPVAHQDRRRPRRRVPVLKVTVGEGGVGSELFGVPSFHHAEAAEFALVPVEITVVVGIARDLPVPPDPVENLDPFDDLHGEGQAGDPRPPCHPVVQIEPCRRRVANSRFGSEIVFHTRQKVRLLPTHQIHVEDRPLAERRQRR